MPVSLPSCWGTLWNRLPWMWTWPTRGSGSASMDLGTAGPVWPTWSHFMTRWPSWWMKKLWQKMDFSKIFDTVSHSILMGKLAAHSSDKCSLHWVKNCVLLSIFFHTWSSLIFFHTWSSLPFHWLWSPKHLRSLVQYWSALPCTPQQNLYPWASLPGDPASLPSVPWC